MIDTPEVGVEINGVWGRNWEIVDCKKKRVHVNETQSICC